MTRDMDHATLLERLAACECSVAGRTLLADPDCAMFYPLARQRIVSANLAGVITSALGTNTRRAAKLRGLGNILRHEAFYVPRRKFQGPITLAMLSYSTLRRFRLPGGWPDLIAEPFLSAAEATGGSGVLFEVPANGEYRTPAIREGHLMGMDELRAQLLSKLCPRPAPAVKAMADFVALWHAHGLKTGGLAGLGWVRAWNYFDRRRALFARQLERFAPEVGIVVNWYGTTAMAFTAAAQEAGIPVADIQHGVQGPSHGMYGHWPKEALVSTLIPHAFLNWSMSEAAHLSSWIGDKRRTYICGLPWLHLREDLLATSPDYIALKAAAGGRPVLLVSLQADPRALLDLVEATLVQPGADRFAWALRCHPGQHGQMDIIAGRFAGQTAVLPVREATLAPLALVLRMSSAHLTEFSSVVLEAAAAGLPSFLSSSFGRGLYPDMSPDELSVTPDPASLLAALSTLAPRRTTVQLSEKSPSSALAAFRADAKVDAFGLARP